nr:MAG TPA: hypothetical protein [Caudoviricetes sp.]DAP26570.1 MAG TPA: hypothetical protein [Caudoviricetes sp.]
MGLCFKLGEVYGELLGEKFLKKVVEIFAYYTNV